MFMSLSVKSDREQGSQEIQYDVCSECQKDNVRPVDVQGKYCN